MATVIEAAGNLVFTLILNRIRELYLEHLEAFRADRRRPRRARPAATRAVAEAIARGDADAAARRWTRSPAARRRRCVTAP